MSYVLDASAIMALLLDEDGSEIVEAAGPGGHVSAVNLSEVIAKLLDRGLALAHVDELLGGLAFDVAPFDGARARGAGALRNATRGRNISFADRACLALAMETGLPVLTGDREWSEFGLPIDIRLIR